MAEDVSGDDDAGKGIIVLNPLVRSMKTPAVFLHFKYAICGANLVACPVIDWSMATTPIQH